MVHGASNVVVAAAAVNRTTAVFAGSYVRSTRAPPKREPRRTRWLGDLAG
eukprot:gene655-4047_t